MTAHSHENTKTGGREANNVVSLALYKVVCYIYKCCFSCISNFFLLIFLWTTKDCPCYTIWVNSSDLTVLSESGMRLRKGEVPQNVRTFTQILQDGAPQLCLLVHKPH